MSFSINGMQQCKFEHAAILISRDMESGGASSPSTPVATRGQTSTNKVDIKGITNNCLVTI